MGTLLCKSVADYFLVLVDRENGDSITQLKLQKLMYFAQGMHLKLYNKPLFQEEIEAWEHGPVVKEIRKLYGSHGSSAIFAPEEIDFEEYSNDQKHLIYGVYHSWGQKSAGDLVRETHEHPTWKNHVTFSEVIPKEEIVNFFKSHIHINDSRFKHNAVTHNEIEFIEDEWMMNYNPGIESPNITQDILDFIDIKL